MAHHGQHSYKAVSLIIVTCIMFHMKIIMTSAAPRIACSNNPVCMCILYNTSVVKADCSGLNIQQFPNFESFVTHIELSNNAIQGMSIRTPVPPKVRHLDISYNNLQFIDKGVIGGISSLQYLDFSFNRELNFDVFLNISEELPSTSIEILRFSGIYCEFGMGTQFLTTYTTSWNETSLSEIHLANNRISHLGTGIIRSLPKTVKILNMSFNRIVYSSSLYELHYMSSIQFINVSNQNSVSSMYDPISGFLQNCTNKKNNAHPSETFFTRDSTPKPNLKVSNINVSIYFPESLIKVDISDSLMTFVHFDVPFKINLISPNMKQIYMQGNIIRRLDISGLIPASTEFLDLSNNFCSHINDSYFPIKNNLKTLYLKENLLGTFLEGKKSSNIFRNLRALETLSIAGNRMRNINKNVLLPLSNLRHLDLSMNDIDQLLISLIHFKNLTMLDLSQNRLRYLNERTLLELDYIYESRRPIRNLTINLQHNNLQCSCETLFFFKWMLKHKNSHSINFQNVSQYTCSSQNLTVLHLRSLGKIVDHFELICRAVTLIYVLCSLGIVTYFFFVVSGIVHRNRWKLRFFYYSTKRAFRKSATASNHLFYYDVFLSYANEDRDFVHNVLLRELENDGRGFKVCCHLRDFTPGRPVADNIVEAIHISRHTLCVISTHYLNSRWCMYEHNIAMVETDIARGGEDAVILAIMTSFRSDEAPLSILRYIQSKSYLEVPPLNEKQSIAIFVERLKSALTGNS